MGIQLQSRDVAAQFQPLCLKDTKYPQLPVLWGGVTSLVSESEALKFELKLAVAV